VLPYSSESFASCVLSRNTEIHYTQLQCYLCVYGYATWCLTSKDIHMFRMFKNRDVIETGQDGGT
jgi:hypothetical protein